MNSASSLQLSRAWWKKEAPEGLGAAGDAFAAAIAAYAKANAALRKPTRKALTVFEAALDDLEDAGKDVAAAAKALEKAEKKTADRARLKDLKNTATVMGRPLARELDAARASADAAEAEWLEEEGGGDDPLGDPRAHAAYISGLATKLKRGNFNFALALTSNEPVDMRFAFHRKKGGRSLGGRLRRGLKVKKWTFGVAGAQQLAEEVAGEDVSKRTLVLYVEGRKIPSLARRVKVMLKRLGVSQFTRVKVYENGQEIERADEDSDEALEEIDLSEEDPDDDGTDPGPGPDPGARLGPGPAPKPAQGAPATAARATSHGSTAAAGLRRRLTRVSALVAHLPRGRSRTFDEVASLARRRIDQGALGQAERAILALEARVGGTRQRGRPAAKSGSRSAPRPAPGPAGREPAPPEAGRRLSKLRLRLRDLAREAKAALAAAPEHRDRVVQSLDRARKLINARAAEEAEAELRAIEALLEAIREPAPD